MSADGQDLGQINMELFDEVNMSLTNKSEITVRFLTKLGRLLLLFYEQTVETMSNEHGHLYLQTPMSKE